LAWAEEEFGSALLGDERRTRRLVQMAAAVATRPAGTVTRACACPASKEGAFRWLENPAIHSAAVVDAMQRAVLGRCRGQGIVHVPVDATSLSLTDESGARDLGAVGSWSQGSRGVHVMTAFVIGATGAPLGICGQQMWLREQRSKTKPNVLSCTSEERETRYWLELLRSTHDAFQQQRPDCRPFFQLDRGADCWPVLALAHELQLLLTVRAAHNNRRVDTSAGSLRPELEKAPVRARFRLDVPARGQIRKRRRVGNKRIHEVIQRRARTSTFTVRAAAVPLLLQGKRIVMHAVLIREHRRPPDDRIEWLLLTTSPIKTKSDLHAIIHGYTQRWRIEEFHRTWKRGLCRVEDTQLRSRQAIFKWATILAAVAARALRLTYLAREKPDLVATAEFSRQEIQGLIALRQPPGIPLGHVPTLSQAVRWLAELGGYTGPWNGPPGPTVIGRGLHDLLLATRVMRNLRKMR